MRLQLVGIPQDLVSINGQNPEQKTNATHTPVATPKMPENGAPNVKAKLLGNWRAYPMELPESSSQVSVKLSNFYVPGDGSEQKTGESRRRTGA